MIAKMFILMGSVFFFANASLADVQEQPVPEYHQISAVRMNRHQHTIRGTAEFYQGLSCTGFLVFTAPVVMRGDFWDFYVGNCRGEINYLTWSKRMPDGVCYNTIDASKRMYCGPDHYAY